jgi:hypothetical protein
VISTEQLNLLWLDASQDEALLRALRDCLDTLHRSAPYQHWLKAGSREPFALSSTEGMPGVERLEQAGLVQQGRLEVKVNRIGDRLFLTDGPWVSHLMRVFPDPDEALLLLDHARERGLVEWADWVIDPSAGCGHTPIGFPGRARRISCDVNARAVLYASLNARLNQLGPGQFVALLNDMNQGLPPVLELDGNVLFFANVPFAPSARRGDLALNSAGGSTGADLQVASFQLVRRFQREYQVPVRACFLTWTVGSMERDEWEVPQLCRDIFAGQRVEWALVDHDYDGPELPNPTPIADALRHLASSQYTVAPGASGVQQAYAELTQRLVSQGHTHVAYGMLDLNMS